MRAAYRTAAQERDGHYVRDHVNGAMIPRYMKARNPPEGATVSRPGGAAGTVSVEILEEEITVADLPAQFDYLIRVRDRLDALDDALVQPRGAGFANPSRIRSHLRFVMTAASSQRGEDLDARPTAQLIERLVDLEADLEGALTRLRGVYVEEVGELHAELESAGLTPIRIPAVPGRRGVS